MLIRRPVTGLDNTPTLFRPHPEERPKGASRRIAAYCGLTVCLSFETPRCARLLRMRTERVRATFPVARSPVLGDKFAARDSSRLGTLMLFDLIKAVVLGIVE